MGPRDFLVSIEHGCANCATAVKNGTLGAIGVEYCCSDTEISSIRDYINVRFVFFYKMFYYLFILAQ
jgi:hypothetical protein